MWLRISYATEVIPVNAVLVSYRVQAGSMSSDPQRMAGNRLAVLAKQKDLAAAGQILTGPPPMPCAPRPSTGYRPGTARRHWLVFTRPPNTIRRS